MFQTWYSIPYLVHLVQQWVYQPPLKTLAPSLSLRPAAAFIKIYSRRQLRPSGGSSLGLIYWTHQHLNNWSFILHSVSAEPKYTNNNWIFFQSSLAPMYTTGLHVLSPWQSSEGDLHRIIEKIHKTSPLRLSPNGWFWQDEEIYTNQIWESHRIREEIHETSPRSMVDFEEGKYVKPTYIYEVI